MRSLGLGGALSVLCLGAHPDDIEIGCGGTLLGLGAREDVTIRAFVLTGSADRQAESTAALAALAPGSEVSFGGLPDGRLPAAWSETKQALEDLAADVRPDVVLAPRIDDAHQDHRLVGGLASTTWRDALILHYEIPKWDGDQVSPTHYVPMTDEQAHRKVEILNASFPSQVDRDWWDDEMFLGLMRLRGMECRHRYAEGFVVRKAVLDLSSWV